VGGQHHAPGRFTPGKTRYPLYRRLGGSQGQSRRVRKISPPPGFHPRTVQPVVSHYTNWATRLTSYIIQGNNKGNGKVYLWTGHEGPGWNRILYTLSLTSALDGGAGSTPCPGQFNPGKDPVPTELDAGWTPEPLWTGAKNLAHTGIQSRNVQPVESRYTVYSIAALYYKIQNINTDFVSPTLSGPPCRIWCPEVWYEFAN
jgi:hypothetical protein